MLNTADSMLTRVLSTLLVTSKIQCMYPMHSDSHHVTVPYKAAAHSKVCFIQGIPHIWIKGAGPHADLLLYSHCKAASCLAGHFLWCGERTRQLDAAHVEFMRGIGNPIGVKVSDKMDPNDLVTMIHAFNPENTPGRLAVIVRMGQEKLRAKLPALVSAVERAGQTVTWICDPMHGNTESCGTYKTRRWVHHPLFSDAARSCAGDRQCHGLVNQHQH